MQQTTPIPTPIPTPPITTEVPSIITDLLEITTLTAIQLRVANLEQDYLGSKLDDTLHKVLQRHAADLIQKYSVQPVLESSKKQESEKSPEEILKIKREQAEKQQTPKPVSRHQTRRPDLTKRRRPKCRSVKKPSTLLKEPLKVIMDEATNTKGEDVVLNDDQPQDSSAPKTNKTDRQTWFEQPPRPPTPDPEWNKR
ncbi:hypothetical protein Tco_0646442 [Tanacetum coccineum]